MANIKTAGKSPAKTMVKTAAKSRDSKKTSIVNSNVASFVNQANYAQRVQEKAYELYLQRGGSHGNDLNDWFKAEKLIASKIK